jgi:hypothetical protein
MARVRRSTGIDGVAMRHYRELHGPSLGRISRVDRLAAQRASERVEASSSDRVAPALIVLKRRKRHADGGGQLALSQAAAAGGLHHRYARM